MTMSSISGRTPSERIGWISAASVRSMTIVAAMPGVAARHAERCRLLANLPEHVDGRALE